VKSKVIKWIFIAFAAISGAAMALQGTFNAAMGKIIGVWESTLIVHIIGTITVLVIILLFGIGFDNFSKLTSVPWYAFLGGLLNVIIIYIVVRTIPKVGVGNATTAIIVAQISTAVLIDSLGAFGMKRCGFQYLDLLGILFLAIGAHILLMD
jgi:transporter family-2 protein